MISESSHSPGPEEWVHPFIVFRWLTKEEIFVILMSLLEKTMCFPRSKPFLLIAFSFFTILLAIFTVQIFDNRSNERSLKAAAPLPFERPVLERKESTSRYWRDRRDVQPRWSHFLQSPEEALTERRAKPQNESIFWEEVQEDLTAIIREKFPDLKLSQSDLQRLTETIRPLQKSMLALGELERTKSNREEIQKIRSEVNRTLEAFEEITQMSISDFILYGRPESGLDNGKPDDEEIIEEYLDHYKS
jgi:hypothetical protein